MLVDRLRDLLGNLKVYGSFLRHHKVQGTLVGKRKFRGVSHGCRGKPQKVQKISV